MVKKSTKADDHNRWGHLKFGQRGESFKGYTEYGQKPRVNAQRPTCLGPDVIDQFHLIGTGFLVRFAALIDPADVLFAVIWLSKIVWTRWHGVSQ